MSAWISVKARWERHILERLRRNVYREYGIKQNTQRLLVTIVFRVLKKFDSYEGFYLFWRTGLQSEEGSSRLN